MRIYDNDTWWSALFSRHLFDSPDFTARRQVWCEIMHTPSILVVNWWITWCLTRHRSLVWWIHAVSDYLQFPVCKSVSHNSLRWREHRAANPHRNINCVAWDISSACRLYQATKRWDCYTVPVREQSWLSSSTGVSGKLAWYVVKRIHDVSRQTANVVQRFQKPPSTLISQVINIFASLLISCCRA